MSNEGASSRTPNALPVAPNSLDTVLSFHRYAQIIANSAKTDIGSFLAPPVQGQLTAFQCAQENSRLAWVWFGGAVANYSSAINAPSNVWPEPRDNAASWQLGNKLYILGGKNFTLGL